MSYYQRSSGSNGDNSRQRGGHSRSNSGQHWVPHPGYAPSTGSWNQGRLPKWYKLCLTNMVSFSDTMGHPTFNPGGYYPDAAAGYPPTQQTSPYGPQYPQHQGYPSAFVDPAYMNSVNVPTNYSGWQPSPGVAHPSVNPNAAPPSTPWSQQSYNPTPPQAPSHTSSYPRSHTPGGSSSRNNHSRQPSATQIHLPDPEPHPGIMSGADGGKVCSHCHATATPLWRRDPRTHKPLCNACGLYEQQHGVRRPQTLIAVDTQDPEPVGGDSDEDGEYDGRECGNCGTRRTSAWRRDKRGAQVCNACGVYERMNGRVRPLKLRNDKIRPREKH